MRYRCQLHFPNTNHFGRFSVFIFLLFLWYTLMSCTCRSEHRIFVISSIKRAERMWKIKQNWSSNSVMKMSNFFVFTLYLCSHVRYSFWFFSSSIFVVVGTSIRRWLHTEREREAVDVVNVCAIYSKFNAGFFLSYWFVCMGREFGLQHV